MGSGITMNRDGPRAAAAAAAAAFSSYDKRFGGRKSGGGVGRKGLEWPARERRRKRGMDALATLVAMAEEGGVPAFHSVCTAATFPTPLVPPMRCHSTFPPRDRTACPPHARLEEHTPRTEAKGRDKFPSPSGLLSPGNRSCINRRRILQREGGEKRREN